MNIENQRAERTQLDNLRRQISGLDSEREALARRKTQLEGLQGQLREQRDAFQNGRVEQLEARVAELTAEIAAATAKETETKSAFERATRLKANGWQTDAATVEVPNLATGPDCHVGRTGKVTFKTAGDTATAAAR